MRQTPLPLRRELSVQELADNNPYDSARALGSYWAHRDDADLQSLIVKYFKQNVPDPMERPGMRGITHAYAAMITHLSAGINPTAVVRVLASGETHPQPSRSHSHLISLVAKALEIPDATGSFFRSEPRKPMRMIDRFSGTEMLRQRIDYVAQDLFVVPRQIGGTVLLIDDIFNLGATARVYAAALKKLCGADRVFSVNLAAARFQKGSDGWGKLELDMSAFLKVARKNTPSASQDLFEEVWIERDAKDYHLSQTCPSIGLGVHRCIRLFASKERTACSTCGASMQGRTSAHWWFSAGGR